VRHISLACDLDHKVRDNIEEGSRQRAEGFYVPSQLGIQTPPEWEPPELSFTHEA
jgi:hypothetical protein